MLDAIHPHHLFRCRSILNCVDVCPKGPIPALATGKIKETMCGAQRDAERQNAGGLTWPACSVSARAGRCSQ